MTPWEVLQSPLVVTALGIAGDALKRAMESGADDPHAVANIELEVMRKTMQAGINEAVQAVLDKRFPQ